MVTLGLKNYATNLVGQPVMQHVQIQNPIEHPAFSLMIFAESSIFIRDFPASHVIPFIFPSNDIYNIDPGKPAAEVSQK